MMRRALCLVVLGIALLSGCVKTGFGADGEAELHCDVVLKSLPARAVRATIEQISEYLQSHA